ncbi:hypothetical protein ACJ41O_014469 [Fusarium nematophilum]
MRFKERSVVGMWLRGMSYIDIVHIWGVARAGFIPQVVSFRMTDPTVTYQLLDRGGAVALILDPSFQQFLRDSPFPTWPTEDTLELDLDHLALPKLWMPSQGEDVTMIYHTSGSTSGSPKLVPVTAKWLDASLDKMVEWMPPPPSSSKQEATALVGAFSHLASPLVFIDFVRRGGCLILPTELPYPIAELQQMIHRGGLTDLVIFSSYLSRVIQEARRDPSLLAALRDLHHVHHTGLALDDADGAWAREQGINLENLFACSELGLMLISNYEGGRDSTPTMKTMSTSKFEFLPLSDSPYPDEELLELVVPPESPDCPAESLRSAEDGKYHSGDLFVEVAPGKYLPRGRNDDWIKMECALRCDTGAIEKDAMECCGDLISGVVVVGAGRPSPAMIVEPQDEMALDGEDGIWGIKHLILGRITPFHRRRDSSEDGFERECSEEDGGGEVQGRVG